MHSMLEEIESEPAIVEDFKTKEFADLERVHNILDRSRVIYAIGNGTSYHAAIYLSVLLNRKGMTCIPIFSSEAEKSLSVKQSGTSSIVFSQSGNSIDALRSAEMLKRAGSTVIGITNASKSKLGKITDFTIHTDVGSELSVAATKSHLSQLLTSLKISLNSHDEEFTVTLEEIRRGTKAIVDGKKTIQGIAETSARNTVFLGSGLLYPIALEASLKLMETSNAVSYAFPVREFLHGPKQILDSNWSVFMFSNDSKISEELLSYGSKVLDVRNFLTEKYDVSTQNETVESILSLLFGQFLAYYSSISLGLNPDKPSKLTKVVE